ncbi:MAG: 3-oxoacyl-ACP synthase [Henriciella sp.]|uniref:beta-ketoacyl-ACP synthase III n=1 Tax=uncultured Henriciella sp. TaxID=1608424 RepID=UPI000C445D39|nr:beta-ketoacyl-ACP synthase III [Henriciella sp.]MAN75233.1 3-oxoacyl-ACP synthase [Henriciella sp.]MBF33508.1 3-oxoacyl-ACP synthase [Hyphomonadaceae bacterium]MBK75177.1 3-oxoacyl-ACP synthase [Henriciella sp.]|tara:strand:+ start:1017 stop:1985 length:969 start_codon:yes stop_codon:yes gene_type:complete
MNTQRSFITGTGSYLPARILSNTDLAGMVDTSDEWIRERTGIEQRHIAAEGELTSDLATAAARAALENAGVEASEIDLIVLATTTPDNTFPATATTVQHKLGITDGAAFDVQAVCSGFLFALATADSMLRQGLFNNALVIGAETFTRILDWSDRSTCVLFGDGAGAVVLQSGEGEDDQGVISHHVRTDGSKKELLYVDGGVSSTGTIGHVRMQGNQVFRHAIANISSAVQAVLSDTGHDIADIDWFVPHQANQRILNGVAKRLGLDEEKVISTVAKHGNTSAASIPLALDQAIRDGRIQKGDLVLSEAMGGGFSWGACLFRL